MLNLRKINNILYGSEFSGTTSEFYTISHPHIFIRKKMSYYILNNINIEYFVVVSGMNPKKKYRNVFIVCSRNFECEHFQNVSAFDDNKQNNNECRTTPDILLIKICTNGKVNKLMAMSKIALFKATERVCVSCEGIVTYELCFTLTRLNICKHSAHQLAWWVDCGEQTKACCRFGFKSRYWQNGFHS